MTDRAPATIAAAYSATGEAWQRGPGRIYDRLAEVLVARLSGGAGGLVLDVGAGTGAASRAIARAGGVPIGVDVAVGMLTTGGDERPPAAAGDARALPFGTGAFDAAVAAFSLNHVDDPAVALREAARVVRPGGSLAVSAYATDDTHAVKDAVDRAVCEFGWQPAAWYGDMRREAIPRLATVDGATVVAADAGLAANVEVVRVPFPELGPDDLVEWRLGMAQVAWFVSTLPPATRAALAGRSRRLLGDDAPILVRSMIVLTAHVD